MKRRDKLKDFFVEWNSAVNWGVVVGVVVLFSLVFLNSSSPLNLSPLLGIDAADSLEGEESSLEEESFVERVRPFQCNDGIDNDEDGKIDYPDDRGCDSPSDNNERFRENCNEIYTVRDLDNVRYDLDACYVQMEDIDLSGYAFEPIGGSRAAFTGVYDGNEYKIINFNYNTSNSHIGLFLASSGLIKNVKLINVNISGFNWVGGLVAINNGSIINSFVQGSIIGSTRLGGLVGESHERSFIDNSSTEVNIEVLTSIFVGRVGGLVGNSEGGGIYNSYSTGSISSNITSGEIGSYYGGLVGWLEGGEIENSYATGDINVVGNGVGGLTGVALEGRIENSHTTGTVNGNNHVGGLVGRSWDSVVSNSYALGDVLGSGGEIGGLIGSAAHSFVNNSYALGNVNAESGVGAGGLVGYFSLSRVENSYYAGKVTGGDFTGGLVGTGAGSSIFNSFASADVSGQNFVGGLIGTYSGLENVATISMSYAKGNVSGNSFVGGLIGEIWRGDINNSYSDSIVNGVSAVGGLVGLHKGFRGEESIIESSYATGNVNAESEAGGLVGISSLGIIKKSSASGTVIGTQFGQSVGSLGGLVGTLDNSDVIESFATGNVIAHEGSSAGGLVGSSFGESNIVDSYALGSVQGEMSLGGLVGSVGGDYVTPNINNSYSLGGVTGNFNIGGLIGSVWGIGINLVIISSYWDTQTSGQTTSAGGVGKTTVEMKRQNTFVNWNFNNVWDIVEDITYPFLRWQLGEGLIVHYKFDELANGKTPDSSVYRYDADVFAGATLWQWGKIDGALNFSGWRGRVIVEDTPFLYFDEALTISAWVNTRRKWKTFQTIVWKGNPDGSPGSVMSDNREFALFLAGVRDPSTGGFNSKVQLAFTPENRIGIGQYACTTNTFPIRAENWWYHIAGVIDVRNQVMKIFVDGVEVKRCVLPNISNIRNTNGLLVVGNKMPLPANSSAGFTGMIDDFRLYNRVLSDAEILELAQR